MGNGLVDLVMRARRALTAEGERPCDVGVTVGGSSRWASAYHGLAPVRQCGERGYAAGKPAGHTAGCSVLTQARGLLAAAASCY